MRVCNNRFLCRTYRPRVMTRVEHTFRRFFFAAQRCNLRHFIDAVEQEKRLTYITSMTHHNPIVMTNSLAFISLRSRENGSDLVCVCFFSGRNRNSEISINMRAAAEKCINSSKEIP